MEISALNTAGRQVIESYGGGGFRVSGERHPGSVIVFPEATVSWPVATLEAVTANSLLPLLDAAEAIEILFLGCGAENRPIDPDLRAALKQRGIALDGMDTGAACRTYNVLVGEHRRVAAALIALD